jgi:hypothetical protein
MLINLASFEKFSYLIQFLKSSPTEVYSDEGELLSAFGKLEIEREYLKTLWKECKQTETY